MYFDVLFYISLLLGTPDKHPLACLQINAKFTTVSQKSLRPLVRHVNKTQTHLR